MRTFFLNSARLSLLVAACACGFAARISAADLPTEIRFTRDVRPILSGHCFLCHGPDPNTREADLRLDTREGATADLGEYAAIVPGDPDRSALVKRIRSTDPDEMMPPPKHPKRLSDRDKDILEQWIRQGAKYETHWAYVKPVRPALPAVKNTAWPRNEIDYFVLARLEQEKLSPSPEAPAATLIRRLSLDLTGLPPTPEEVATFEVQFSASPRLPVSASSSQDAETRRHGDAANAYNALVDRLLASPQFGERWARPWLDAARYADSHGFQRDDLREVWAYRDWVIDALNRDMPFDQFTIEQLAGDLLPGPTREQLIATGLHRSTTMNVEAGSEPEESRINQVIDRVNTTAAVWLGSTLECCQCHSHKYDPFTQKEYYQLLAYFNNTELEANRSNPKTPGSIRFLGPSMTLADPAGEPERQRLQAEIARLEKDISELEQKFADGQAEWESKVLAALTGEKENDSADQYAAASKVAGRVLNDRVVAELKRPPARRKAAQQRDVQTFYFASRPEIARLQQVKNKSEAALKNVKVPTTLVMRELAEPRMTAVFNRGVYTDPDETVTAGVPAVLHSVPEGPANRLTLAHWLVSPENPLTARVTVNRWWAEVFGRGLVGTVEDFGMQGELPTHGQLLDWLAVEFMAPASGSPGWSMKQVLRNIVTSAAYRQSSRVTPQLFARDDQNRLLARGPRFRMDAEMIRDNALAAAGLLSLKKGGPPIRPPQPDGLWVKVGGERYDYRVSPGEDKFRRGVYVVLKRGAPYPSFVSFDASARMACVIKRSRSNTPLQALTLLNDPVYVEAAMGLARRVLVELPQAALEDRLTHAFRLALARGPSEGELDLLRSLYNGQLATAEADAAEARKLVGAVELPPRTSVAELAGWYGVASALMNLDEMITKN